MVICRRDGSVSLIVGWTWEELPCLNAYTSLILAEWVVLTCHSDLEIEAAALSSREVAVTLVELGLILRTFRVKYCGYRSGSRAVLSWATLADVLSSLLLETEIHVQKGQPQQAQKAARGDEDLLIGTERK